MAGGSNRRMLVAVLLFSVAALGLAEFFSVQRGEVKDEDIVAIDMVAKQWEYDPSEIRVKEGQTVLLRIKSTDVPHGLAIEEYRVNIFLPPGEVVEVKLNANKAGEFIYFCNVFCGTGHPNHKGKLIVEK